jgi:hypothetical protein
LKANRQELIIICTVPTVFRWREYRFFFFSREEERPHEHVRCGDGEAKFWLDPEVSLAVNHHLSKRQLAETERVIKDRRDEIIESWREHFAG